MNKLFFILKFFIWIGVITFFIYNPGEVEINWLNYNLKTSLFFLFAIIVFIDKIVSAFDTFLKYILEDVWKNISLSYYKSEVKNLKKINKKQKEKMKSKIKKKKEQKEKLSNFLSKIKNVFIKKQK